MKPSPQESSARRLMEEGVLTLEGFLGQDPLGLDRVHVDAWVLAQAGVTSQELGEALERLWRRVRSEGEVVGPRGITVEAEEARGGLPCPFGHPGIYPKGLMRVRMGDVEWKLSPLSIHLIRAHGFFGGLGSPYRVEPADALELLRLLGERP